MDQSAARGEARQPQLPLPDIVLALASRHLPPWDLASARLASREWCSAVDGSITSLRSKLIPEGSCDNAQQRRGGAAARLAAHMPSLRVLVLTARTFVMGRYDGLPAVAAGCMLTFATKLRALRQSRGGTEVPLQHLEQDCDLTPKVVESLVAAQRECWTPSTCRLRGPPMLNCDVNIKTI